jgi:hypothetical protein
VIQEVNIPTNYEAENNGIIAVTMPKISTGKTVNLINNYMLKTLSVQKVVLADTTVDTTKKFTMALTVDGALYASKAFNIIGTSGASTAGTTGTDGTFQIGAGETAVFTDVAAVGKTYSVLETPDATYVPVYPAANTALNGTLTVSDNNSATIINGKDAVVIRKKYEAADGDTNAAAELATYRTAFTADNHIAGADVYFETYGTSWAGYTGTGARINTLTGAVTAETITAGVPQNGLLQENEVLAIYGITNGTQYRISEKEPNTGSYAGTIFYGVDRQGSEYQQGSVGTDVAKTITNKISSFTAASSISKYVTNWSTIPSGAKLVFEVDKWDGTQWIPAYNVKYAQAWTEPQSTDIATTDYDGIIKADSTDCSVSGMTLKFESTVHTEEYYTTTDPAVGDLMIRERMDLSDASYGFPQEIKADSFINANATATIQVAKTTDVATTKDFTFSIAAKTVVGATTKETAGTGLVYDVYETGSNTFIKEAKTDSNGHFTLQSGQYAKISAYNGIDWEIKEVSPYPYVLSDVTSQVAQYTYTDSTTGNSVTKDLATVTINNKVADVKTDVVEYNPRFRGSITEYTYAQLIGHPEFGVANAGLMPYGTVYTWVTAPTDGITTVQTVKIHVALPDGSSTEGTVHVFLKSA